MVWLLYFHSKFFIALRSLAPQQKACSLARSKKNERCILLQLSHLFEPNRTYKHKSIFIDFLIKLSLVSRQLYSSFLTSNLIMIIKPEFVNDRSNTNTLT